MSVEVETENGFVVVRITSLWLNLGQAKEVSMRVLTLGKNTDVVLDLLSVECADLSAIRSLAVAARRVKLRGGTIQAVVGDPQIKRLFFACQVDMIDAFRTSVREACWMVGTEPSVN